MTPLNKKELLDLYRMRAVRYDFTANLYYLIGFREYAYRRKAVEALRLQEGDSVVEISCGTGLNFSLLQQAVGKHGRIIGVDFSEAMLDRARSRIERNDWKNVELIHSDAARYKFPHEIDGILSTFAITLIPEFDEIIKNGAEALRSGKRWVVLDFKLPSNGLAFLVPLAVAIMKPFGVSLDLADRHPWESIKNCMSNYFLKELYGGFAYIAVGERLQTQ